MTLWSKFKTCNKGINIEHKQKEKHILTDDENYHGTQYIKSFFFWYLLVLISKSLKIGLQKPQIWPKIAISLFKPILSAILVTIATGKNKINARILHLG